MSEDTSSKLGILSAIGQYYGPQPYQAPPPRRSSGLATIGGVFILISGILGLLTAVYLIWFGNFFISDYLDYGYYDDYDIYTTVFLVCGALMLIFSILALLGGVMAMTKKSWGMGIVGGIFALFTIGPLFLASILGLIGLIMVGVSKADFQPQQPVQQMQYGYGQPMPPPPAPMGACRGCGGQIPPGHTHCPFCGMPR
jgi:hypothetical protein